MKLKKWFSHIKTPKRFAIIFILIVFISWSILLYKIPPLELTKAVGVNNSYLLILLVAFLGGSSILIPFPYYLFIVTFGAAGLNPFLIGFLGGLGLAIGDSTSYIIGYHGREIFTPRFQRLFKKFCSWCNTGHIFWMYIFLFIYGAIIPIPNDVIVVPLGLSRYPYWKMAIPLALGNMVYTTGLALIGFYGLSSLF